MSIGFKGLNKKFWNMYAEEYILAYKGKRLAQKVLASACRGRDTCNLSARVCTKSFEECHSS
ncbi:MAG: hypothetical protein CFE21_09160 [Bacteroidetes bacterium B1(2017)]|nr:MAG: hypothetical protein CFE21_09160 [Bacteroidetes bacterium B1(2017)]